MSGQNIDRVWLQTVLAGGTPKSTVRASGRMTHGIFRGKLCRWRVAIRRYGNAGAFVWCDLAATATLARERPPVMCNGRFGLVRRRFGASR